MKAISFNLRLALIGLILSASSLHAQWDTLLSITNPINQPSLFDDICFVGHTGYAVGLIVDTTWNYGSLGSISKTTDNGQHWTRTVLPGAIGNDTITELTSVNFTSADTGYTVAKCFAYTSLFQNPNDNFYYYGALLKTTDGGLNWSVILSTKNQIDTINSSCILFSAVQFTSPNNGYIAAANWQISGLILPNSYSGLSYRTTDAGATWNVTQPFSGSPANSVSFNNNGNGIMVGGWIASFNSIFETPGKIARSTDAGNTWNTQTDSLHSFTDVAFPSPQTGYIIGFDAIMNTCILKTTDGGQSWIQIATIPYLYPTCVTFITDSIGYIGGYNSGWQVVGPLWKTTDGGSTWLPENFPSSAGGNYSVSGIAFSSPNTGFATVSDTLFNNTGRAYVYGNFNTSSISVSLGPDTTFCQTQGQLIATPTPSGSDYVFDWTPGTGLSDSTAQSPFVSQVYNQQYILVMTDTVTGWTASDTIVVSSYNMITGPKYICSTDSTLLDFGPGATNYFWQFYTDTAGNTSTINQNTQTYWATQEGYYLGFAQFTGCGALTSYVQVVDTCAGFVWATNVWPGDCNYDLNANMSDALYVGLAYNTTGPVRPSASNSWVAQPMTDWSQNFTTCNYKHADSNGDGFVDMNDTLAISQNYGNTHPYRLRPVNVPASAPSLILVANYDTVGFHTYVTVDIRLGTLSIPLDSLYGISFRLTTDAQLVDTTQTFIFLSNTWIGTDGTNLFGFRKYFRSAGIVDAAESRIDHANRLDGSGSIGSFRIVTTDNLSGIAVCHFNVSDITAVTVGQNYLTLNTVNDSVVIDPSHPAGLEELNSANEFHVYPNPANENVTVQTHSPASTIEICDMMGRTITSVIPNSNSTTINTSELAEGVYLLKVKTGNSITTQKLSITR